jgi:hypothetical protein
VDAPSHETTEINAGLLSETVDEDPLIEILHIPGERGES